MLDKSNPAFDPEPRRTGLKFLPQQTAGRVSCLICITMSHSTGASDGSLLRLTRGASLRYNRKTDYWSVSFRQQIQVAASIPGPQYLVN